MDSSVVQKVAAFLLAYVVWRVTRSFLTKSSLSNIPGPPNTSWLKGHFGYLFNKDSWAFHRGLREKYGHVIRIKGLLGSDHLYISDPLALHHIFVKDQYTFEETRATVVSNRVVIGICLQSSIGEEHKKQRKMLNPVFSTKHMREMLPMLYPIVHQLRECIKGEVRNNEGHTDVIAWISRAALEYIGQGGLGYSFSAFDIDKKSDSYADAFITFFPSLFRLLLIRQLSPWIVKIGSPRLRERILDYIPFEAVKEMRRVVETLESSSRNILRGKREAIEKGDKAVLAQVGRGKDIMSILLKANAEAKLPESELIGHMNLFVLAGHDTTTNAVSRILHLLALNLGVQSKLREEVTLARKKYGDLDYDTLQTLPYLNAVCRETMRVHPPVPLVDRVANKDVILPLKWPIRAADGKTDIREIMVPKGTGIIVPISGANSSKEIWGEDAEEWLPERWLKPLPESVADARLPGVYSQMMTFIGGGRAFFRNGNEYEMILSVLLETFVFEPGPEIFWQFSFIYTPVTVGTMDNTPRLPLKVSLVKGE